MTTKQALIEKLRSGGQITLEDLESLGSKKRKDPEERPAKVCSPKNAIAKVKKGAKLNKWELEELAKSPEHAVEYATQTGERFPGCEENLVAKGANRLVAHYFLDIVKEKNEVFEKWLVEEGQDFVRRYCEEVLKSRWEEGEKALLKIEHEWRDGLNADHALAYQRQLIKGPWDALERVLLNGKEKVSERKGAVKGYFRNCGVGRSEMTEARLLKYGNTAAIFLYAIYCVGGRLPNELHNKMVLSGKRSAKRYVRWLASKKNKALNYLKSLPEGERREMVGMLPETSERTG